MEYDPCTGDLASQIQVILHRVQRYSCLLQDCLIFIPISPVVVPFGPGLVI